MSMTQTPEVINQAMRDHIRELKRQLKEEQDARRKAEATLNRFRRAYAEWSQILLNPQP